MGYMSSRPDEPIIPSRSDDDRDLGWGERSATDRAEAERDEEIQRDRPPHW